MVTVANTYAFTTTNFDDEWAGTATENGMAVTKGSMKVLLHYPDKKTGACNTVVKDADYNVLHIVTTPTLL